MEVISISHISGRSEPAKRDVKPGERVKRVVRAPNRLAHQLNSVHLSRQRSQHSFALRTRHILADAIVNADAKREVADGPSGDVGCPR